MSGRVKAASIILVVLTACTIALVAGLSMFANSQQGRALLLGKLNAMIPGTLTASHHHVSLFSGEILIRDLSIQDPQGNALAGFDSLFINLSLTSLLKKSLSIEAVDLKRPWAHLTMDEKGRLNILNVFSEPEAKESSTPAPDTGMPFNIILRQFTLSKGYLSFTAAGNETGVKLDQISLAANGNLRDKSGVLKLDIGKSQLKYNGYQSDFEPFDLALAMKNGNIEPLVINTENQFASLLLYGDVRQAFSDPELDLRLNIDLSLGATESFFHFNQDDTGRIKAYLTVKGRVDNPDIDLKVGYGGGRIQGHTVQRVDLLLHMADRVATIERLHAATGFGDLRFEGRIDMRHVFPNGFFFPPAGFEKAAYEGQLQTTALDLAAIGLLEKKVNGELDALLTARGQGISLQTLQAVAAAELSVSRFSFGNMSQPADIRLSAAGGLREKMATLGSLEIEAAETHFSAGGSLDFDTKQIDTHFSLSTREVSSLLSLFGLHEASGACTLDGRLTGPLKNPALNISAAGETIQIQNISIGNVNIEAGVDENGRLTIGALNIENGGGSVKAKGDIQLLEAPYTLHREMPLSAKLVFSNIKYSDFLERQDIKGSLTGSIEFEGSAQSLIAIADIKAGGVAFDPISLGDVAGKVRFSDGTLFVDSIRLTNNSTDLDFGGELRLFRKGSWQAIENPDFKLTLTDGRIFMEDFVDNLKGTLVLEAELGGQLKRPQGTLHVTGKNLDFGMQRVETIEVTVKTEGTGVNIDPVNIVLPCGGAIKGSGRLGFDKSFQFQLHSKDLSIESIDKVREMKFAGGKLAFDISGKGQLDRPEINGNAELKEIRIKDEAIDDFNVHFDLKDNHATISGKHTFDLNAGYDLLSKAFFMDLRMKNTNLTPYFVIAGRSEFGGNISGSIKAEGYAGELERTRAIVDIYRLDIDYKGEHVAGTKDFRGAFENRAFEIPGFHVELLDQGHFSVKGSGDIYGSVKLDVEGNIPLRAANMFVRDLPDFKGMLSLKTSVAGTLQDPEFNGEIRIEDGGVTIPELQQKLHSLNGRVVLSAGDVIVGDLDGMLDDGRFDITATIELDGFLPKQLDARVSAVALPFQIPETMEMLLNTNLSINGTPDRLLVGGELILLEGTYYKDFKLNLFQTIQETEREETPQTAEITHPYLKPIRFDIHLKHRQPFLVDNNIAEMEISPDIVLTGTPNNPVITGSAKVEAGIITYQNKSFVVQRGVVDFINPYKTEPEIDIKGEVVVRQWRITISLYGPPDRLVVELSSSPPEEDADIISLLVFKKTTYELNEGSSGVSYSPTVLLTQLLASSFGDDIMKSTGIDILEVEAESATEKDSSDRIKVTVGKDLSDRMTVKYSVESKDGGYVQRASTEYKLLEHILVSGFQDTKGVYGGEFIFRVEFRLFR